MDTSEDCYYETPQTLDETNYHNAYHADAVTSFAGNNTLGPNIVKFTWNPGNIHNERAFLINWFNTCTGQWQIMQAPGKNATEVTLSGLQGGSQQFQIAPLTFADPDHNFAGDVTNVTVTVIGALGAPGNLTSSFPSTTVNRLSWSAVSGAHHYHVRTDFSAAGSFPYCSANVTATQFDANVPTANYDGIQWYNKITACDINDVCSALGPQFTLTERSDTGGWNYAFTYYKSGSNINFQYIDFMPFNLALALHVTNGNLPGSTHAISTGGQDPTPCILYNQISSVLSYAWNQFSSGFVGTVGHTLLSPTQCGTGHTGDATTNRWGTRPP